MNYAGCLDIEGLRAAQAESAILVDSREEKRYQGLEEPIDPVAGHIPGAVNYPWQGVTDDDGYALHPEQQIGRWTELEGDRDLVVYCGSGVTACVNILSLALTGREDVKLYAGSCRLERTVVLRHLARQHAHRPPVADDVMHRQQQHMVLVTQTDQLRAQQRTTGQVEELLPFLRRTSARLLFSIAFGQITQIHHRQRVIERRGDHLDRFAIH